MSVSFRLELSIRNLGYDFGYEAYHSRNKVREEHDKERDKYHCNDSANSDEKVLAHSVAVCCHNTEEDKEAHPYERDRLKKCCDSNLIKRENVRKECCGDTKNYHRNKCVCGCYENILEVAFAIEESCKTPVSDYPKEQRNKNCCHKIYYFCGFLCGIGHPGSTDCVVYVYNSRNSNPEDRSANGASLFMLKIPEAVKRVHYDVEAEQYFFPEGSLPYLSHAGLVNLANIGESLYKENTKNNNYDRNNDEVFVDPLFTIKLERVGIV